MPAERTTGLARSPRTGLRAGRGPCGHGPSPVELPATAGRWAPTTLRPPSCRGRAGPPRTVRSPVVTEQPRTCPACAAANRPIRELCGRCGVGLDDGVMPPHADRARGPRSPRRPPPDRGASTGGGCCPVLAGLVGIAVARARPDPRWTRTVRRRTGRPERRLRRRRLRRRGHVGAAVTDVATRTTAADADAGGGRRHRRRRPHHRVAVVGRGPARRARSSTPSTSCSRAPRGSSASSCTTVTTSTERPTTPRPRSARVRLTFDGGVEVIAELLDVGLRAAGGGTARADAHHGGPDRRARAGRRPARPARRVRDHAARVGRRRRRTRPSLRDALRSSQRAGAACAGLRGHRVSPRRRTAGPCRPGTAPRPAPGPARTPGRG